MFGYGALYRWASVYLDISVDNLVLVQVPEPLQDLSGVEDDGRLLQRTPFRPQQRGQASWRKERRSVQNLSWNGKTTKQLERPPSNPEVTSIDLWTRQIFQSQFLRTEGFFFYETKDSSVIVLPSFSLSHKHTSRHLFHEDLDVSVLRNGAQVLNNVPVLQVLVKGDLLMEGLGVPESHTEKKSHREIRLPLYS